MLHWKELGLFLKLFPPSCFLNRTSGVTWTVFLTSRGWWRSSTWATHVWSPCCPECRSLFREQTKMGVFKLLPCLNKNRTNCLKMNTGVLGNVYACLSREKKDDLKHWCATCHTHFTSSIPDHRRTEEHKVIGRSLYREMYLHVNIGRFFFKNGLVFLSLTSLPVELSSPPALSAKNTSGPPRFLWSTCSPRSTGRKWRRYLCVYSWFTASTQQENLSL